MSLKLLLLSSLVLSGCVATTPSNSALGNLQQPPFPVDFDAEIRVKNGVFEAYNHKLNQQYMKNGCINVLFDEKSIIKIQNEGKNYFSNDQNDFNLVGEIYFYQDILLDSLGGGVVTSSPVFTCNDKFILVVRDLVPRD